MIDPESTIADHLLSGDPLASDDPDVLPHGAVRWGWDSFGRTALSRYIAGPASLVLDQAPTGPLPILQAPDAARLVRPASAAPEPMTAADRRARRRAAESAPDR